MKILVMAAGAVRGYFGGLLARNGEDVTFVARNQNLEAISSSGLKVESIRSGNFTIHPSVVDKLDGTWKADLVLFTVKSYHNEQAMETIKPAVADDTNILTTAEGVVDAISMGQMTTALQFSTHPPMMKRLPDGGIVPRKVAA